jgi:hypothetical protein
MSEIPNEPVLTKGPTQEEVNAFIRINSQINNNPTLWNMFNAIAFLLLVNILVGAVLLSMEQVDNYQKVKDNWKEYRCQPFIMPLASFYGYDTADNFEFCMKSIFTGYAQEITSPFSSILGIFGSILGTISKTISSIKESIATMGGGINTVFQDFTDRIMNFFFQLRLSAIRIRTMILRMQAIMYSVIYMGISGIKAGQNFGNTVLFSFLDTFCFPPETPVEVDGKGLVPIYQVQIGDVLLPTKSRVTSKFHFAAQGQPMVRFQNGIEVSTNHFLEHNGKWIRAEEHPDATPIGAYERQSLICLNTNNHVIPMKEYRFCDYDETAEADAATMRLVEERLNGPSSIPQSGVHFTENSPSFHPETRVKLADGSVRKIRELHVNQRLSTGDVITGIFHKEVSEVCHLPGNEILGAATLVWNSKSRRWTRIGTEHPIRRFKSPVVFIGLITTTSSQIELASGLRVRDYLELCSPDTETFYANALNIMPIIEQKIDE